MRTYKQKTTTAIPEATGCGKTFIKQLNCG